MKEPSELSPMTLCEESTFYPVCLAKSNGLAMEATDTSMENQFNTTLDEKSTYRFIFFNNISTRAFNNSSKIWGNILNCFEKSVK